MRWEEADAGHFRHLDALDFEEKNVKPQCTKCNRYLSGNLGVYAVRLAKLYGIGVVEELNNFQATKRYSMTELMAIREKYQEKIAKL